MKYLLGVLFILLPLFFVSPVFADTQWQIQSIDTMKYSRDLARQELHDQFFDKVIEQHIRQIARTGANYVAIDTPYDEEFVPYLQRWVKIARMYHLHVWFRGNFSGWEGWFGYPRISRKQHLEKVSAFITNHPDLFADGDIFTSCPECENGGPGDPRTTGDVTGYREFIIAEYQTTQDAFQSIHKKVRSNFFSMNADVARLVMDKPTTHALNGVVVIDQYVKDPDVLVQDIKTIAGNSGGRVMLGEFGAPILDINGPMSNVQQASWLSKVLQQLAWEKDLIGINYWTDVGGSTQLWDDLGNARKAVSILTQYFTQRVTLARVTDKVNNPISGARINALSKVFITDDKGEVSLPYLPSGTKVHITSTNYFDKYLSIIGNNHQLEIQLTPKHMSWWKKIYLMIKKFFLNS